MLLIKRINKSTNYCECWKWRKDGSTVKIYDGNTVIGTGVAKGQTATVTVKGALPGNLLQLKQLLIMVGQ